MESSHAWLMDLGAKTGVSMSSQGRGELSCVHTRAARAQRENPRRNAGNNQRAETVRNRNENAHATKLKSVFRFRSGILSVLAAFPVSRREHTIVASAEPG